MTNEGDSGGISCLTETPVLLIFWKMIRPVRFLFTLTITGILVLFALAPLDRFAALFSYYYSFPHLAVFFNENLYEQGKFGLPDIVTLLLVGSGIAYGLSFSGHFPALKRIRKEIGFVMNTGFFIAVSLVHSIKWAVSRARPHDVYPDHIEDFTHWFEPGAYTLQVGFNRGSFPSGHVATIAVLLTLTFFIPAGKDHPEGRLKKRMASALILLLALVMGWYRMMNATHWLTDNIASLFLSVFFVYFFYYFIHYPSPEIRKAFPWTGSVDRRRAGWEFFSLIALLGLLFSVASIPVGLRISFLEGHPFTGIPVMGIGILGSVLFSLATRHLYLGSRKSDHPPAAPEKFSGK